MLKLTLLATAIVLATACSTAAQPARRPVPTDIVATVGSTPIMLSEVDDKALEQPAQGGVKLSLALYDARRAALDDLIAVRLMATCGRFTTSMSHPIRTAAASVETYSTRPRRLAATVEHIDSCCGS